MILPQTFSGLILLTAPLKGVMWEAHAAKVGFRWNVGKGDTLLFWEDIWVGHYSLVVYYWDLYVIANEHYHTIASVWDGHELKIPFRGTVNTKLYDRWIDLTNLVSSLHLNTNEDMPIWMFDPCSVYSQVILWCG
jgi:hypothetical protein